MPVTVYLVLILVIFICAFGYMTYRHEVQKRAHTRTKKRDIFNDRV